MHGGRLCRACSAVFSRKCTRCQSGAPQVYFTNISGGPDEKGRIDRDPRRLVRATLVPSRSSSSRFRDVCRSRVSQPRGYRSILRGDTREPFRERGYTGCDRGKTAGVCLVLRHIEKRRTENGKEEEKKRQVVC